MRPTFGREYIEAQFRQIAEELSESLTGYLIGGGAMAVRDLKGATKDIDLVVTNGDDYNQLWRALMELGYSTVRAPDGEYLDLGATSLVENEAGCRFDLFNQQVAETLVLTDGMRDRSETVLTTRRLTIRLVSNEDIFLFKLVAGRDEDIDDVNVLVQTGLSFDVVQSELEAQIAHLGDDRVVTYANEALIELEERYGVTTPIGESVQELTDRYYRGLEVLQALDRPTTVDDLAADLGVAEEEVRERLLYLAEFDRVRHDGGRWHRTSGPDPSD